jgi:signal transduction histidine kinase
VPLVIHKVSEDPRFKDHPARRIFGIESYVAVPLHRRDGSYFGVLCALDIVHQEFSDDAVTILNLFSDLIAFELEANERQSRQTDALRQLEEFIAVARHDLRQVLTLLYGWAQLLDNRIKRGSDMEELAELSTTLLSSSREAILLSETLLDTAMVETGLFELDLTRMNLNDVVNAIVQDIRASARDHIIELTCPDEVWINGDRHRIGQVVRNLLDNAVKYVAPSRGPISLDICVSEPDPAFVIVTVRDAGEGVSDEELPRLFDQHFRASSAQASSARGSGLGLYVVRQIVEAHGGTICAERSPAGGLEMRFTLPTG